ncbi:TonB-dependent receptor [Chryseolinea sp. T2]|uniref:TonB-dependent receptor family protein n=1 Tax=Chryseolinea sp. T2 TaxID=3129255 RepID=UPI0030786E91
MRFKSIYAVAGLTLLSISAFSQDTLKVADSTKVLDEIVVRGYAYDRPLNEVPAAVGIVRKTDLERFGNNSLVPVMNTIPGVRMEERSPGSYRFSVRGSLLRSPFGVRNVKVYWNGLPLTDGGGNTYLNLFDFDALTSAEVIKGPGGSLYGAGTGGVLLLRNAAPVQPSLVASGVFGTYGNQRYRLQLEDGNEKGKLTLRFVHHESDGYREQTSMRRDALNADVSTRLGERNTLSASVFYTDLYYGTPGGLTKAQYDENPQQARPPKTTPPAQPGAVQANAGVRNKTGYVGVTHDIDWDSQWTSTTGLYGSLTAFDNPTIRNYESRDETNVGVRHQTQYALPGRVKGKITMGVEYQYFFSPVKISTNDGGSAGVLQSDDELRSKQLLLFSQADLELPSEFFLTLGLSYNKLTYDFLAKSVSPEIDQHRSFTPQLSPRVALLKKFGDDLSVYGSVSSGFSPPSLAEVRPSTGAYNNLLNPEHGLNYEAGLRGSLLNHLSFDAAFFIFKLDETIVIQRADDGAEYFVNAGKTDQRGIEARLNWNETRKGRTFSQFNAWVSYAYSHFRFTEYVQDGVNYSGNRLTGVAPTVATLGLDATIWRFYANATVSYVDAIPLNDANTDYADEYVLVGGRIGFKGSFGKHLPFEVFTGIDNALDKKYSLGNDLNAIGGRYYNAAPPRNYYAGITLRPTLRK